MMKDRQTIVTRFVQMHRRLKKGPVTVGDLAKEIGSRYAVVRPWVNAMLDAELIEFAGFSDRKTSRTGTFPGLYRWKQ
jgi:hypothetical protein